MNDLELVESLCPPVAPLPSGERAAMRRELFGSAAPAAVRRMAVRHGHEGARRRQALAVAAVALLLAGVVGLWSVSGRDADEPAPAVQPPPSPSLVTSSAPPSSTQSPERFGAPASYPVFDNLPEGVTATASVFDLEAGVSTPRSEVLVARREGDLLAGAVRIMTQDVAFDPTPAVGHPATEANVFGRPATVIDRRSLDGDTLYVVWGTGPYFLAAGAEALSLLDAMPAGAIAALPGAGGGAPVLDVGALPDGFEVIAGPQAVELPARQATLQVGTDGSSVMVRTHNWVIQMATTGQLRSVEVGGRPAWTFASPTSTQEVTWQVDDSTFVSLTVRDGSDTAAVLDLANQIRFVDFETWTAIYPSQVEIVGPTTAPAPTSAG